MKTDKLLFDILKFCLSNNIIYEYNTQGDENSANYEMSGDKIKFIITVVNVKDKLLYKIIDEGFTNLKKFVEEFSTK